MNFSLQNRFSVGKFLVSPYTHRTEAGDFSPCVSIRSGRGSETHDRVFHLMPSYATHEAALRHAIDHSHGLVQAELAPRIHHH